ncbi:MAG: diguanylate cyclase [Actinomycetota bacterium]|nr:diguanylate cyclase [Actinomycetota bacterium]
MNRFNRYLRRLPAWMIIVISVLIVAAIGYLDYLTGEQIGFSIIFLVPIVLTTWYVNRNAGVILSVLSASIWFAADVTSGSTYANMAIPVWNALVRMGFFLVILIVLDRLHGSLNRERDLARTDSLTGAANSRAFYDLAGRELERCRRYGRPFSIAYMDLDNFKAVNDHFGHAAGDDLLCLVADILNSNTRKLDVVARLGGDEFAVMLAEDSAGEALVAVKKLRGLLLVAVRDKGWPVTFSIGLATFGSPPESLEGAIKKADSLMYSVKSGSKDGIRQEIYGRPS